MPLAHAHVRHRHVNGVVHCDLKPSNVLLVESADCELSKLTLKVADFGLSQMLELGALKKRRQSQAAGRNSNNVEEVSSTPMADEVVTPRDEGGSSSDDIDADEHFKAMLRLSSNDPSGDEDSHKPRPNKLKLVCGTPNYFAPELVALAQRHFGAPHYDVSVDNWALGCVIWEMLVGHPPFQASEEEILFYKITDNQLDFPAHLSDDSKDLISSLMTTEPADRLTSEQALAHPWIAPQAHRMGL